MEPWPSEALQDQQVSRQHGSGNVLEFSVSATDQQNEQNSKDSREALAPTTPTSLTNHLIQARTRRTPLPQPTPRHTQIEPSKQTL